MELAMANGFNEMSQNEMMETDGGAFPLLIVAGAWLGLGLLALGPVAAVSMEVEEDIVETKERARRDGVIEAREDYENGFTDSLYK